MYRFLLRPRWIAFHLLVILAVIAMINLGLWQLRRLDERRTFNAAVVAKEEQPPVPLDELLADPGFDPADAEWRTVTVAGTWLPDQVIVFNRSQNGAAGDDVLTALAADDGTTVLVNRGFVPLGSDPPPPPPGETTVVGRLRKSESRQRGGLTDSSEGPLTEVRRVEIDKLAPQYPGEVAPVYVELLSSEPPVQATDPIPVPEPELTEANHLSYAFQWFIFSICAVIGWVLAVRRSARTRREDAATDELSPAPVGPSA
jgi:cytochrome oxidase assembly protein ShyY1